MKRKSVYFHIGCVIKINFYASHNNHIVLEPAPRTTIILFFELFCYEVRWNWFDDIVYVKVDTIFVDYQFNIIQVESIMSLKSYIQTVSKGSNCFNDTNLDIEKKNCQ